MLSVIIAVGVRILSPVFLMHQVIIHPQFSGGPEKSRKSVSCHVEFFFMSRVFLAAVVTNCCRFDACFEMMMWYRVTSVHDWCRELHWERSMSPSPSIPANLFCHLSPSRWCLFPSPPCIRCVCDCPHLDTATSYNTVFLCSCAYCD